MTDFLIKSTISLSVLLGIYFWFFEKEKMNHFNRFFLLGSLVVSFVIPVLKFDFTPGNFSNTIIQNTTNMIELKTIVIKQESGDWTRLFWIFYVTVSLVFLFRFGKNILGIISKIKSNPKDRLENATLILVEEKTLPHTFLNYIFINRNDYENRKIEGELFTHELTHVHQKHTIDILFIEFLKTIFWFNPILMFYKKAIQLNHEFLADEKVVRSYNNVPFYQNLLLEKASWNSNFYLASNLNFSVTKKRLIMMTKTTSRSRALLKKLALLPVLAGLVLSCAKSNPKTAATKPEVWVNGVKMEEKDMKKQIVELVQKEAVAIGTEADLKTPEFPGGTVEFSKYIASNFKFPADASSDKLLISFIVETDGSLSDINLKNNANAALKEEVSRVLKNSPKWNPATVNKEPVRYQLVLPILLDDKRG